MSDQDINIAYGILRRLNDGHEPYAASVAPMAREVAMVRADERAKVLSMIKRLRAACGDHYDAFAVSVDSFIANMETP